MTTPCVTVTPETSIEECCRVLTKNHIRRVPVVDKKGSCIGIVAQADLSLKADPSVAAEVVHEVSRAVPA
jgi:CBS-domain-containing membrane protein